MHAIVKHELFVRLDDSKRVQRDAMIARDVIVPCVDVGRSTLFSAIDVSKRGKSVEAQQ